jgi:hypothetical protein
MPFKHNIASGGGEATYAPALSETVGMFIIANYGSSQGYDNDDGSNHDYSHHNFFYQADGFKMVRGARWLPRRAARSPRASPLSARLPASARARPRRTTAATTASSRATS